MTAYEFAGKSDKLSDLDIGISSLYLLAAQSTPEEARDESGPRSQRMSATGKDKWGGASVPLPT
jgi:hypothetical protein